MSQRGRIRGIRGNMSGSKRGGARMVKVLQNYIKQETKPTRGGYHRRSTTSSSSSTSHRGSGNGSHTRTPTIDTNSFKSINEIVKEQDQRLDVLIKTTNDLAEEHSFSTLQTEYSDEITFAEMSERIRVLNTDNMQLKTILQHVQNELDELKVNFKAIVDLKTLHDSAVLSYGKEYARTDPYIEANKKPGGGTISLIPNELTI